MIAVVQTMNYNLLFFRAYVSKTQSYLHCIVSQAAISRLKLDPFGGCKMQWYWKEGFKNSGVSLETTRIDCKSLLYCIR